ncbi:SsgA family sporulation/cell division regulator [Streptomyces olivaceoviridis]|uniref:SsgA family sporulation/cell division regulator n=1 Tax=Streptomyces olivaceoviridis TaxID=1921 RepID=UPI0036968804
MSLHAALGYSRHDPLAVTLVLRFPGTAREERWAFARDLLDEGMRATAGLSDVRIRCVDQEQLLVELCNRSGYVAMILDRGDVRGFLHDCDLLVPVGRESIRPRLDAFLATLLP